MIQNTQRTTGEWKLHAQIDKKSDKPAGPTKCLVQSEEKQCFVHVQSTNVIYNVVTVYNTCINTHIYLYM